MTVFEPDWDDETPDEDEAPTETPVMALPDVIVIGANPTDSTEPDWMRDDARGWGPA